ncbi:MAG: hypothetical protein JWO66_776 [Candidatus Eremiobacteraeota bacterium]|nr:hypothetical protein [Candidatus Eremiobacteraeota bacterium]
MKNVRYVVAALAALSLAAPPLSALAQTVPSYAEGPGPYANGDENIHGRIVSFNGAYDLRVQDNKGYVDDVQLHQGTIINPTGITLQPGMVISVLGYNAGSYLAANEIDTPYTFYGGVPYWQGHPWSYYGPSYGLGLYFGNVGWWHGSELRTGYHYVGGVRVYPSTHVYNNIYQGHGGGYSGRNFNAPSQHGGYVPHAGGPRGGFGRGGGAPGGFGNGGGQHVGGGAPGGFGNGGGGQHGGGFGGGGQHGGGGGGQHGGGFGGGGQHGGGGGGQHGGGGGHGGHG